MTRQIRRTLVSYNISVSLRLELVHNLSHDLLETDYEDEPSPEAGSFRCLVSSRVLLESCMCWGGKRGAYHQHTTLIWGSTHGCFL